MNNVSLVLYVIRVRDCEEKSYYNLDDIKGEKFIDILEEYSQKRRNISCQKDVNKAISVKKYTKGKNSFSGQVEIGNYGYSSEIKSVNTSHITHTKTTQEVEMIPLFFSGIIPKDAYKGLIALEKFKTFGCKTILQDDLNKYLKEKNINGRVTLHPILPEKIAKQYLERGNICKVRLVRHTVPKDIADTYKDEYKNGEFGTFEYVITPKRNQVLPFKPNVKKFLNNAIGLKQIIEIQGVEYDNMKLEIEIGGKKRTVSLRHLEKLTGDIDISDEVTFELNGHPQYLSILQIAKEIIKEYVEVIDYKNYEIVNTSEYESGEVLDEVAVAVQ